MEEDILWLVVVVGISSYALRIIFFRSYRMLEGYIGDFLYVPPGPMYGTIGGRYQAVVSRYQVPHTTTYLHMMYIQLFDVVLRT